jgi:anti-anti-sigma factor
LNRTAPVCSDPAEALVRIKGAQVADREDHGGSLRKDPVLGIQSVDSACVVRLGGELDLYNAHVVREALFDACANGPNRLVVDLSEVEFMDSTALGVLIEARTKLPNRKAFHLAAPGLETRRALQISGLDRHFAVHDTVPEALAAKP